MLFFFQAEDGIRDAQESRGLGDVYKRQVNFKRGEWEEYHNHVSDWEVNRYLKFF